jgi:hypothetical protein
MARPKKEQVEEKVYNSEEIEMQAKENSDADYQEVVIRSSDELKEDEEIQEVVAVFGKEFNEAKSVDDIYGMLLELHSESETLQRKASIELGLIPTQLQVVTNQLNICKNNIARALGK